jgi:hypothetical protein
MAEIAKLTSDERELLLGARLGSDYLENREFVAIRNVMVKALGIVDAQAARIEELELEQRHDEAELRRNATSCAIDDPKGLRRHQLRNRRLLDMGIKRCAELRRCRLTERSALGCPLRGYVRAGARQRAESDARSARSRFPSEKPCRRSRREAQPGRAGVGPLPCERIAVPLVPAKWHSARMNWAV